MIRRFVAAVALVLVVVTASAPAMTAAWAPFGNVGCNRGANADSSAVCKDKGASSDPLTGSDGLILKITNLVAIIAGIAAVIIIILAGLRFVTAGGSSEDIAGARRTIIYASVGLVVIVIGRLLIGLILSKL